MRMGEPEGGGGCGIILGRKGREMVDVFCELDNFMWCQWHDDGGNIPGRPNGAVVLGAIKLIEENVKYEIIYTMDRKSLNYIIKKP